MHFSVPNLVVGSMVFDPWPSSVVTCATASDLRYSKAVIKGVEPFAAPLQAVTVLNVVQP